MKQPARKRLAALAALLSPERLTEIVDIGANPLSRPDYQPLVDAELARVMGFEPNPEAFAALKPRESTFEWHLPYAVGDGGQHELKLTKQSGFTSLFEPRAATLAYLGRWKHTAAVVERMALETKRLDDLGDITQMDFLKIDIQGGELAVFQNGRAKLASAVAVMTEVAFIPLYEGQPLMDAQMAELRAQGFILHRFVFTKTVPLASPFDTPEDKKRAGSQLVDGDAIFIRDLSAPETIADEALVHLALLAEGCFNSPDLALRCLTILMRRGQVRKPKVEAYADMIREAA